MAAKHVAWGSTLVMTFALLAVVVVAVWVGGGGGMGVSVPIDEAYAVDDDTLLIAGTSGKQADLSNRRWGQVALLGLDGQIRHAVRERGVIDVIGVTDQVVWIKHSERGVHARRLTELSLVEGIQKGVDTHPVLSNRAQAQGFTRNGVVFLGANNDRYEVDMAGAVRALEDGEEYHRAGIRIPSGDAETSQAEVRRWQALLKERDEIESGGVVVGQREGMPITFDDGGALAQSIEFVVGGQMATLHRVDADGAVQWSLGAAAAAEAPADSGFAEFTWVGLRDGKPVSLVGHSTWDRDMNGNEWATHDYAIVWLDPASGEVTERTAVGPASE